MGSYENLIVSITTVDTALIKAIPIEQFSFDPAKALKKKNVALYISLFSAFMGVFIAITASRNAAKKKVKS
jgi:hypothetical protein